MPRRQDISRILKEWPFDPLGASNIRRLELADRVVLQMRVDMGVLQLETTGRPDGATPHQKATYLDYLRTEAAHHPEMQLTEEQCLEVDREFVQYYQRRVCWLQLKEFRRAVEDADHTIALMDFCQVHSPSEQWTLSHEQYRPFVLYHRTQAAALDVLQLENGPELAIEEINRGLAIMHQIFVAYEAEEQFDEDELVQRLQEFRESLRNRFEVGKTLKEQLEDAVASEQYELAAKLRDRLNNRNAN
jgi:hypothetical protein